METQKQRTRLKRGKQKKTDKDRNRGNPIFTKYVFMKSQFRNFMNHLRFTSLGGRKFRSQFLLKLIIHRADLAFMRENGHGIKMAV